jgi:nitrogen fixation-related uncharacterized protein
MYGRVGALVFFWGLKKGVGVDELEEFL